MTQFADNLEKLMEGEPPSGALSAATVGGTARFRGGGCADCHTDCGRDTDRDDGRCPQDRFTRSNRSTSSTPPVHHFKRLHRCSSWCSGSSTASPVPSSRQ
jgi:hypothetical protein